MVYYYYKKKWPSFFLWISFVLVKLKSAKVAKPASIMQKGFHQKKEATFLY